MKIAQEEGWEVGQIEETVKLFQKTTSTVKPTEYTSQKDDYLQNYVDKINDPLKWIQGNSGTVQTPGGGS